MTKKKGNGVSNTRQPQARQDHRSSIGRSSEQLKGRNKMSQDGVKEISRSMAMTGGSSGNNNTEETMAMALNTMQGTTPKGLNPTPIDRLLDQPEEGNKMREGMLNISGTTEAEGSGNGMVIIGEGTKKMTTIMMTGMGLTEGETPSLAQTWPKPKESMMVKMAVGSKTSSPYPTNTTVNSSTTPMAEESNKDQTQLMNAKEKRKKDKPSYPIFHQQVSTKPARAKNNQDNSMTMVPVSHGRGIRPAQEMTLVLAQEMPVSTQTLEEPRAKEGNSGAPKINCHQQGSSHQRKQWRKKKRPKQGLLDRQQEWHWARQKRHHMQEESILQQPDLFQGRDQEHDGDEYFDHISNFTSLPGDCTWFGFQNTDRWQEKVHPPPMVTNWSKSFCQQLVKYHFSGFGGAEHGLDFCQLPVEDQWQERVQGTGLGKTRPPLQPTLQSCKHQQSNTTKNAPGRPSSPIWRIELGHGKPWAMKL
jgi:hypothetical protein